MKKASLKNPIAPSKTIQSNWIKKMIRHQIVKLGWILGCLMMLVSFTNCMGSAFSASGGDSASATSASPTLVLDPSIANEINVMAVNVGCSGAGYVNEPCVTVTICTPGTTSCQTISNVLLDTGSYGLRLFSSVVSVSLANSLDSSGNKYAECVSYADGSSQWGPVKTADVILGQETASNVPIQIIDSTFGTVPAGCTDLDTSASSAGFNGILGVGLFVDDCGSGCATTANNKIYYSCSGSSCTSSVIPIAQQVSNPVGYLSMDNNGVIMQMQSIPESGAVSANGYLILGINTRADNQMSSVTTYKANDYAEFTTTFSGSSYPESFIDSGSNGLFFPSVSSVTACSSSSNYSGFFCPTSQMTLTATQAGTDGSNSQTVAFNVADASSELSSDNPNFAFNNLGGAFSSGFDWGLPFFFGRSIAVGLDGHSSSLGSGPYWAW